MEEVIRGDAVEFGRHLRAGGWRLGLLVARNVRLGAGAGRRGPRDDRREVAAKISAKEFAKEAGTSDHRVTRHLEAWEKAAEAGLVPPAETLSPGDEIDLDAEKLPAWSTFYDASKAGGYNGLTERLTPVSAESEVRKIVSAYPEAARGILGEAKAIDEITDGVLKHALKHEGAGPMHVSEPGLARDLLVLLMVDHGDLKRVAERMVGHWYDRWYDTPEDKREVCRETMEDAVRDVESIITAALRKYDEEVL